MFGISFTCPTGSAKLRICMYMKMRVYSTLAKLVVEEEKKGNPDLIHHTQTGQTHKCKMNKTPGCPALRTDKLNLVLCQAFQLLYHYI